MPGMAASPRIFEYINLPEHYELIKLSWMPAFKGKAYRLMPCGCARILHENPVLLGVSFGGILVQEMAKTH